MKKLIINSLFLLAASSFLPHAMGQTYQKTATGIKMTAGDKDIMLEVYSPTIIRVIKMPKGETLHRKSLSVNREPEANTHFKILQTANAIRLQTDSVLAVVGLADGNLTFYTIGEQRIFGEKPGSASIKECTGVDKGDYIISQSFFLKPNERIYGLGQQQNGSLNQRNKTIWLVQGNTKVSIPFFQSSGGYGIFWDNYSPTLFKDTTGSTSFTSQVAKGIDYYFMKGNSTDEIVAQMRFLTGSVPLLPLWVYGYSQSRERYKTQFELLDVVKQYRKLKVPLDGIIQDWQYWGDNAHWNAMDFDSLTYPRPQDMVDSVHALNAHLFVVAWPGFGPSTPQYKKFQDSNMLLHFDTWPPDAGARVYDVYDPDARNIYWSYLNRGIFSLGVDAWWLDSSEPDHLNEKDTDFDEETFLGSYRSVRNAFPLEHVGGIYEHQRKVTDKKRVVILTRSAFAGQQRYGANTWSGDVTSDWETFARQIPAGLNFSLTGLPYWNTDIGGFFAGKFKKDGGAKNPAFQELYTRWLQFGTFMPMMRSHGTDIPREIYQFGKKGDLVFDVLEKFIKLRYRLLPYLYSTAWQVTDKGGSIMRPLQADFGADSSVAEIGNEYLFGKSILVSPVTKPGIKTQKVYLPAGISWVDFWTGARLNGGIWVEKPVPLDVIPLYVKAGTILPWGPAVQYATEKKWDDLEIRVYPGADGHFLLYEDENDNYGYEKGNYSTIAMDWTDQSKTLVIGSRKGSFPGMLQKRKFNVVLVGKDGNGTGVHSAKRLNKTIEYSGQQVTVHLK